MYLALTDEQTFLLEAASDALGRVATIEATREANDGRPYADLWPVAVEAGWTGLVVPEEADGAGLSAYDAMLVLEACGRRVADARLLGHLPATALLAAGGADPDLLGALAAGERRATLVDAGEQVGGTVPGVLDAPGADVLVVVAAGEAFVVETGAEIRTVRGYDGSRLLGDVVLDGVRGTPLTLDPARAGDGAALQQALLAAEAVGAADACLAMARQYAIDRVAFGRRIGSYQAIKHKLVEMLRRVELGRSALVGAGRAWGTGEFALRAHAARVTAISALDVCAAENVFIHGGVGATWEHDASVYYRRAEHSRRLAGGHDAAAARVAAELLDRQVVAADPHLATV